MTKAVDKPESVGMSASRLERIRPAMQAYVDRGVYAGITTLIARRGKVIHEEQFGWRDREAQTPMTADAIFRLYSMTKPIVCTGLMTLLEEGRFTLFDSLAKYVPAFAGVKVREADGSLVKPARPIQLRDLMTHTSGLTYHFVEDSPLIKDYQGSRLLDPKCSLEAAIDDLARFPLAFQPGTRWRYSVGIDVVGRVIEVISGKPLGDFLRERLFEPLGMVDTGFGVSPQKTEPFGRDVRPARHHLFRPDHGELARGLGEGRQRTPRCFAVLPGRFARGVMSAAVMACLGPPATTGASPRCWPMAGAWTGRGFSAARPLR